MHLAQSSWPACWTNWEQANSQVGKLRLSGACKGSTAELSFPPHCSVPGAVLGTGKPVAGHCPTLRREHSGDFSYSDRME